MPNAYNLVTLAGALVQAKGTSFVVFEANNAGGSQNWGRTFPSLGELALDELVGSDGLVAIEFETADEARDAFTTYAREATENYTSIIGGDIKLVTRSPSGNRHTVRNFEIDSKTYPVFEDGQWRDEIAPDRL